MTMTTKSNDNTECAIVQSQIDNLLDNELRPGEAQPALEHIRACPDCGREYLLARAMSDTLLDLPRPELPPELLERVLDRTVRERVPLAERWREFARRFFPVPAWGLAVPAFAVFAAVAVWQYSPTSVPLPAPPQIAGPPPAIDTEQFSREELIVAIEDLNTTIQTLNEITESMRTRLGDRMVSLPVLSLPALSVDSADSGAAAPALNDPI
ncbi:MAG: hypothetical protein OXE54_01020 [Gammaproteobacteria bacterium]|nr:hypothetical protein [Gammaproteobacteria bacterium]